MLKFYKIYVKFEKYAQKLTSTITESLMRRKPGEEPIYARRSFGNVLPVSPADYDTSPVFGTLSPRYSIKEKYSSKVEIDEKDYPGHLEPNDMARSPAYTISPRYREKEIKGSEYNYLPKKFGSDVPKMTIGNRIDYPHSKSYSSPDKYDTREKFGSASPRFSIGQRLDRDKNNGNYAWIGSTGKDSPGPLYDSSHLPNTYFRRSPRFKIGEKFKDKKKEISPEFYEQPDEFLMGNGSPKTQIRGRTEEFGSWMTKGKDDVPPPDSYRTEDYKGIFYTRKVDIREKIPEKKIKNPSAEYILLPELPRGRQYTIGRKETMDLVL